MKYQGVLRPGGSPSSTSSPSVVSTDEISIPTLPKRARSHSTVVTAPSAPVTVAR